MMRRHQVVTRSVVAASLMAVALAIAPFASAHHSPPYASGEQHAFGEMVSYQLTFPVQGPNSFGDSFYSPRAGGTIHHATDIMAAKMIPVVATNSGRVKYVNWSRNEVPPADRCCSMVIEHYDGWESWYIHLNNDTPGTDDGQGWGIAPGIVPGVHVDAGQLIGWVGDSGNAENTSPHLHYELKDPQGILVNPYLSLKESLLLTERFSGGNRYATAIAISQETYPNGARVVYLASGVSFPDALAGGPAAAKEGAPILLSTPTGIHDVTLDELERLRPDLVVILGGASAISDYVISQVLDTLPSASVERRSGDDRYATATAISGPVFAPGVANVFVASGENYADALIASPAAAINQDPLLLVRGDSLPDTVANELSRLNPDRITIVGGTSAVSSAVALALEGFSGEVIRIQGPNRYSVSVALSHAMFPGGANTVYIATGLNFPDALTGGPAAPSDPGPLLLVPGTWVPAEIEQELARLGPSRIVIFGGGSVVSYSVATILSTYIV
jgi:putative cell wall-binding protein